MRTVLLGYGGCARTSAATSATYSAHRKIPQKRFMSWMDRSILSPMILPFSSSLLGAKPLSSRVLRSRRRGPLRFPRPLPARRRAHRHAGGVLPGLQHAVPGRHRALPAAHPRGPAHELRAGWDAVRRRDLHLCPRPDPRWLPRRPLRAEARVLHRHPRLDAALPQLRDDPVLSSRARESDRVGCVPRVDLRAGSDARRFLVPRGPQGDCDGCIRDRRRFRNILLSLVGPFLVEDYG